MGSRAGFGERGSGESENGRQDFGTPTAEVRQLVYVGDPIPRVPLRRLARRNGSRHCLMTVSRWEHSATRWALRIGPVHPVAPLLEPPATNHQPRATNLAPRRRLGLNRT